MRAISFSILSLALCSAATIAPREAQVPTSPPKGSSGKGGLLGSLSIADLQPAKLANVEKLQPRLRATAKRTVSKYGPYVLTAKGTEKKPGSLDKNGQAFFNIVSDGMCKGCTILAGKTGLVFEDGTVAGPTTGVYVHHILSSDISKSVNPPVERCPDGGPKSTTPAAARVMGAGFIGQGDDNGDSPIYFTTADGKFQSGFMVGNNDRFILQSDLVNYLNVTKNVYITMDLEYVDGHVGNDGTSVLLSVTGCQRGEPKLNRTGPAETMSPRLPIKIDGYMVTTKGHMHDGGERMILYLNDKEVCNSVATYGSGGDSNEMTIVGMSLCGDAVKVKKGDYLTMKSIYDLSKHPLRSGSEGHGMMGGSDVMGMFSMTLVETKS